MELVLSAQQQRIVRNDNTVTFNNLILQLPPARHRAHFVRCPVTVHQFSDGKLGVSYQGRLLARYGCDGELIHPAASNKVRVASAQRLASEKMLAGAAATHLRTGIRNPHFSARARVPIESAGGKMSSQPVGNLTHTLQPQEAT